MFPRPYITTKSFVVFTMSPPLNVSRSFKSILPAPSALKFRWYKLAFLVQRGFIICFVLNCQGCLLFLDVLNGAVGRFLLGRFRIHCRFHVRPNLLPESLYTFCRT